MLESENGRHKPTLEVFEYILDRVTEKYRFEENNIWGRGDAWEFAVYYYNYAKANPGEISEYDKDKWKEAIQSAVKGEWNELKEVISDHGQGFLDTSDGSENWIQIGRSLQNLAESI